MKKRTLVTRRWIPYVLVLLLGGGLVSCKPPAPQTVPAGPKVQVRAGETVSIRASAEGADRYEWTRTGVGEISTTEGPAVLYTAPTNELGVAMLSVTARNWLGASPPTSLTINVLCPTEADAEGTVSPAVAISSIIFVVNGADQIADDSKSPQMSPGDLVGVKEVTICVDPFEGSGGQVYVEFDPVDTDGETIKPEVKGTRAVPVATGFTPIPGPNYTWTVGGNWRHISVVPVHYPAPPQKTKNEKCELEDPYICEVDDRMIVPIQ